MGLRYLLSVSLLFLVFASDATGADEKFQVNGYLRAGTNYSTKMTKGVCYKLGVAAIGNPGRFGNECDNLLELVGKSYLLGILNTTFLFH